MSLGELRQRIDNIDTEILTLFELRMDTVKQVAEYKLDNDMKVLHPEREDEILDKRSSQARDEYKGYTRELFEELMKLSRDMQEKIIEQKKGDVL